MNKTRMYCYGFHCDESLPAYDVHDVDAYRADGVMVVHRNARVRFARLFPSGQPLPANVILWGVDPWEADPEAWHRDVIKRYPSRVRAGDVVELCVLVDALAPRGVAASGIAPVAECAISA